MGEPALLPTQTPVLTLVHFCERCQLKRKPGTAKADLEKLNHAFRSTEEGRAELFQFYRLLLPEVLAVLRTFAVALMDVGPTLCNLWRLACLHQLL